MDTIDTLPPQDTPPPRTPGEVVEVTIERNGETLTVEVTLGTRRPG